jgi:hypothetical protein
MKYKLGRLIRTVLSGSLRVHSSQYGEDVILHKIYRRHPGQGYYVDIGAHHPFKLSNTVYLWALGWSGINVDANEDAVKLFNRHRPDDINIYGAAVAEIDGQKSSQYLEFFFDHAFDLSATCDKSIAMARGFTQSRTVPTISINEILTIASEKLTGPFHLLNIDIEGMDEQLLSEIERWPCHPHIILIEIYAKTIAEIIEQSSYAVLTSNGYDFIGRNGHTCIFQKSTTLDANP